MPELTWVGKDKVITHHLDVPYRVLDRQYSFDETGQHIEDNASENMIIHGDNLEALKALLPKYEGKVDCIYIDPPYNTGKEGWIYNDAVNDPRIKKWLGEVVGREGEDLSRHDKWLCMMYPRLRLLHRLLSPTGVIFISIDDNEAGHLRVICDEIFSARNFIETYIWESNFRPDNSSPIERENAQYVMCYAREKSNITALVGGEKKSEGLPSLTKNSMKPSTLNFEPDWVDFGFKEGKFAPGELKSGYVLETPLEVRDGKATAAFSLTGRVIWSQRNLEAEIEQGTRIVIKTKGLVPYSKKLETAQLAPNTLLPADRCGDILAARAELRALFGGYPFDYPKPSTLIKHLISMLVDAPNDALILDSFAGSGTTGQAVIDLNRQDGGRRRFIMVELGDYADSITSERVKRFIAQRPNLIDSKTNEQEGFSYYELGSPLLIEGQLNPDVPLERVREYIWFTETGESYRPHSDLDHPDYLGRSGNGTSFFFAFDPTALTVLDRSYLSSIPAACEADSYVIYADTCLLSEQELLKHSITFKKIPRDITSL